jgi:glutamate formiminotransferase/formiminotetrahydrofolate cyclodeaminase
MTVRDLADEVSRDTPAPGGGSIAALAGALGAGLAAMVANLTHGKAAPGMAADAADARDARLSDLAARAQEQKDLLLDAVDADTDAFNDFLAARRLPNGTPDEKTTREAAMQAGLKQAIEVPGALPVRPSRRCACRGRPGRGQPQQRVDAAVGAQMAFSGLRGAVWNVLINLKDIKDAAYVAKMREDARALWPTVRRS